MSIDDPDEVGSEDLGNYVPVAYAKGLSEAERYRQLLEDHDIPALLDEDLEADPPARRRPGTHGVPILVPESLLEDSREFIADFEERDSLIEEEDEEDSDDEDDEFEGREYGPDEFEPDADDGPTFVVDDEDEDDDEDDLKA